MAEVDFNENERDDSMVEFVTPHATFDDEAGSWPVATNGYSWANSPGGPVLVPRVENDTFRHYRPTVEAKGLFNAFCRVGRGLNGFRAFANRYGVLNIATETRTARDETLASWEQFHAVAVNAGRLWNAISAGDGDAIDAIVVKRKTATGFVWAYTRDGGERFPREVKGTARDTATTGATRLLRAILASYMADVKIVHRPRADGRSFDALLVPQSLRGFIMYDLSRQMCGEYASRKCKICDNEFVVAHERVGDLARPTREFCSAKCKQQDHRNKVKLAKAMKAEGRKKKAIASHFDVAVEVIENWLTKDK